MSRWPDRTPLERLLARLQVQPSGCIVFIGSISPYGYGQLKIGGRSHPAHRAAYEAFVGPIPDGLTIDHLCRNRACCNPEHLEPVTRVENVLRGMSFGAVNARKTHCHRGHPLDEANTYRPPSGGRHCRACRAERLAA